MAFWQNLIFTLMSMGILKKCMLVGVVTVVFHVTTNTYYPARHARRYNYVTKKDIHNLLELQLPKSGASVFRNCIYEDVILNSTEVEVSTIRINKSFQQPSSGGEYKPKECAALINTAVIVPYRNRTKHLHTFLNYMHKFLQNQNIQYRIFIVEQNDTLLFNRGKMLNYGAKFAMSLNYDCLILHDVDLLPLNTGNIYGCTKSPRHMACNLDKFRYNLPYLPYFGGAISILSRQYQEVNGMSNLYYGWGGEDDDFYNRVVAHGLVPCRFSPELSRYATLLHEKEPPSKNRFKLLATGLKRAKIDGLNSLPQQFLIKFEELYTHLIVS